MRDERERQGKQVGDVWRALKIHPNYLAAVEEGRFDDMPSRAFTIGYVSRCARHLQLDVERLSERFQAEIAAHDSSFDRHVDIEPLSALSETVNDGIVTALERSLKT